MKQTFARFRDGWGALEARYMPEYVWRADLLTLWRERILFTTCLVAAVFGPLALIPSLILSYIENRWDIIVLDTGAYLVALLILAGRRLPLPIRAGIGLLLFYSLGAGLLILLGPNGAGYIWLFGASVMAACLVGVRAAIFALILNVFVLLAVAGYIHYGRPPWAVIVPNMMEIWLVMTVNFMLINALVSITTAALLRGLMNAFEKEREAGVRLRRSEERFRRIVENLPIMIVGTDGTGRYALWNRECERVTGYPSPEIVGRPGTDPGGPALGLEPGSADEPWRPGPAFRDRESELICKNGRRRTVAWTNVSDVVDVPGLASWAVGIDVTERKQAEREVLESKEKYRLIFDNAIEGILVIQEGRIPFINQRALEMAGRTSGNEESFLDWIHPEDRHRIEDELIQVFLGEPVTVAYSTRLLKTNGDIPWVDISPVLMNWEGRPAALVFITDVTDRVQAAQEKARLEEQLQQARKMEAVGTLAGGIAHDFNNLLQIINGYAQMLLMSAPAGDPEREGMEEIWAAGIRAAELVRQLLLFSRKAEAKRQVIDLNTAVAKAGKILDRTVPKMIRIDLHLTGGLWPVLADPVQIEQALLNFGTNAVDAMPDGGRLLLKTENLMLGQEDPQTHSGVRPGKFVLLTVSDTGHGMSRATMEKIFDPFFTTKEIGKGTGLGLASVYGIVNSHGGTITCDSGVGTGTTFKMYLPATEPEDQSETPDDFVAEPLRGGVETILLVDDEEPIRNMASQALMSYRYTVLTASSGEEALNVYASRKNEIDLIVMDLGMPGMGGHRCLKELIRIDPEVKVLIASGYSSEGLGRKTLEAGAAGYVGKPYQLKDLLRAVRAILDGTPAEKHTS